MPRHQNALSFRNSYKLCSLLHKSDTTEQAIEIGVYYDFKNHQLQLQPEWDILSSFVRPGAVRSIPPSPDFVKNLTKELYKTLLGVPAIFQKILQEHRLKEREDGSPQSTQRLEKNLNLLNLEILLETKETSLLFFQTPNKFRKMTPENQQLIISELNKNIQAAQKHYGYFGESTLPYRRSASFYPQVAAANGFTPETYVLPEKANILPESFSSEQVKALSFPLFIFDKTTPRGTKIRYIATYSPLIHLHNFYGSVNNTLISTPKEQQVAGFPCPLDLSSFAPQKIYETLLSEINIWLKNLNLDQQFDSLPELFQGATMTFPSGIIIDTPATISPSELETTLGKFSTIINLSIQQAQFVYYNVSNDFETEYLYLDPALQAICASVNLSKPLPMKKFYLF